MARQDVLRTMAAAAIIGFLAGCSSAPGSEPQAAEQTRETALPAPTVLEEGSCVSNPEEPLAVAPSSDAIAAAQREWIDGLPAGPPPSTPWWHDGVLHIGDVEVETPMKVTAELIEVAGGTVLIGDPTWDDRSDHAEWAVVRGDRLQRLPTGDSDPALSVDGRIAFWSTDPQSITGQVVTWDVETDRELATRDLQGELVGIDADGIAYVRGEHGPSSVTEWNVRADTVEPSDLTWDPSRLSNEQCSLLAGLERWHLDGGYVSPDGTREVFTGPAPGDASSVCCPTRLRVRPVGPIDSVDPSDVTTLGLPEGVPHLTLWHRYADRGTWGVWWETDETVLLDAVVDGRSYLVRCTTTGGACERVFELGPGRNQSRGRGALYNPAWGSEWSFAHAPVTE